MQKLGQRYSQYLRLLASDTQVRWGGLPADPGSSLGDIPFLFTSPHLLQVPPCPSPSHSSGAPSPTTSVCLRLSSLLWKMWAAPQLSSPALLTGGTLPSSGVLGIAGPTGGPSATALARASAGTAGQAIGRVAGAGSADATKSGGPEGWSPLHPSALSCLLLPKLPPGECNSTGRGPRWAPPLVRTSVGLKDTGQQVSAIPICVGMCVKSRRGYISLEL